MIQTYVKLTLFYNRKFILLIELCVMYRTRRKVGGEPDGGGVGWLVEATTG